MENIKLVFLGTEESDTHEFELICHVNHRDEIFIQISDPNGDDVYDSQFIALSKETAIKLHEYLGKQISYIQEDVIYE